MLPAMNALDLHAVTPQWELACRGRRCASAPPGWRPARAQTRE